MKAYKGFVPQPDGTLKCRDKTYRVGETYTEPDAVICQRGMHACLAPIDVLGYYPPNTSVYYEVEVDDDAQRHGDEDSKVASKTLKVGAEIGIPGLIKAQVEYTIELAKPVKGSTTSGDQGAAQASGDQGAAQASGYRGAAQASGDRGAAQASGYQGAAQATGKHGVATAAGFDCTAKGIDGCVLFLIERDPATGEILAHESVQVGSEHGGQTIQAGVAYILRGGKVVEA